MICAKCGKPSTPTRDFCVNCGAFQRRSRFRPPYVTEAQADAVAQRAVERAAEQDKGREAREQEAQRKRALTLEAVKALRNAEAERAAADAQDEVDSARFRNVATTAKQRVTMKCDKCGSVWQDAYDFCPKCGAQMTVTALVVNDDEVDSARFRGLERRAV